MPLATIHVLEGRYNERRLGSVSKAVQDALISILKIPSDDFFQIIHELPRNRFLHTSSFLGMKYSDDFIVLELASILVAIAALALPPANHVVPRRYRLVP